MFVLCIVYDLMLPVVVSVLSLCTYAYITNIVLFIFGKCTTHNFWPWPWPVVVACVVVGLDPEERVRFRNLISDLADESIVILSSHIVSDIDSIADTIAIMKNGKLLTTGKPDDVIKQIAGKVYETSIPKENLSQFKDDNLVVSTARKDGKLLIRNQTPKTQYDQATTIDNQYCQIRPMVVVSALSVNDVIQSIEAAMNCSARFSVDSGDQAAGYGLNNELVLNMRLMNELHFTMSLF